MEDNDNNEENDTGKSEGIPFKKHHGVNLVFV